MAFYQEISYCLVPDTSLLKDGTCHNFGKYNTAGCDFDRGDCKEFNHKFPDCKAPYPTLFLGDGKCDGPEYNTPECNYDDGDCKDFNADYPNCEVDNPYLIANGKCNEGPYNTTECGFDGGDCLDFWGKHPDCVVENRDWIFDGSCDNVGMHNTPECGFDGGDCLEFNALYPDCTAEYPGTYMGDEFCRSDINTPECGYDGGDCTSFNQNKAYENCTVDHPGYLGDNFCDGGAYNTPECGFDGGDCNEHNEKYPGCKVTNPTWIGSGRCNGGVYNTQECGYDGGDCEEFNAVYPNCTVNQPWTNVQDLCIGGEYNPDGTCAFTSEDCEIFSTTYPECVVNNPALVGDGICHSGINSAECGYDGGDCTAFNIEYPDCDVDKPALIGNGECNLGDYSTEECGFDGGDCDEGYVAELENCPFDLTKVGDGYCDGKYNIEECVFDGGDCEEFNSKYPGCVVENPDWIGNGICSGDGPYNTAECGFDEGDCEKYNSLKECNVTNPWQLGNGYCDHVEGYNTAECEYDFGDCDEHNSKYPDCNNQNQQWLENGLCDAIHNIEECGFDGGDCADFNMKYPNCTVDDPRLIGNNVCSKIHNTPECGFDGGDCDDFNDKYPLCQVDKPDAIGNGICEGGLYNTKDCGFDEGDCEDFNKAYLECFGIEIQELQDGICQHNTAGCNYDDGDCADSNITSAVGLTMNGRWVSIVNYQRSTRNYSIIQVLSSIASLFASIGIIWIIRRSHKKLSTPLNRLLLGLCIADIISSLAQSFLTLPAPSSIDVIWGAMGNKASCQAQGFFIFLGSIAAPLYNCSLCIYSYKVVTFRGGRDADAYIKKAKIEYLLHAVPIGISLIGAIIILSLNNFNPNMTYCYIGADPTCDDLECERTNRYANILFSVFSAGPYIGLPCIIGVTMTLMYRAVLQSEKKLSQYGVATLLKNMAAKNNPPSPPSPLGKLRKSLAPGWKPQNSPRAFRNTQNATSSDTLNSTQQFSGAQSSESVSKLTKPTVEGRSVPSMKRLDDNTNIKKKKSNRSLTQSRAVLNRAFSYSMAFLLTYLFPIIISIRTICKLDSGPTLSILARIFFPLQGFFNFVVFIAPKVVGEKRKGVDSKVSWFGAFVKAVKSRGLRNRRIKGHKVRSRRWLSLALSRLFTKRRTKRSTMSTLISKDIKHTKGKDSGKMKGSRIFSSDPNLAHPLRARTSEITANSSTALRSHSRGISKGTSGGASGGSEDLSLGSLFLQGISSSGHNRDSSAISLEGNSQPHRSPGWTMNTSKMSSGCDIERGISNKSVMFAENLPSSNRGPRVDISIPEMKVLTPYAGDSEGILKNNLDPAFSREEDLYSGDCDEKGNASSNHKK